MPQFKYQYKGESFTSSVRPSITPKGYLVILPDNTEIELQAVQYPGITQKNLWTQSNRLDDLIVPYDQCQAMGEAFEKVIKV